ncbi:hypothetical protein NXS98_01030 [Fontisphaera persica]|uniref:hypothetical protein n=1 Tax=Fontisphaera persica TaxID=2974023 RepID=UPI0024BF1804|nr:hypothetical protein [Fontisphaera persica]WCJ59729.1 hypothetical protein NXS98_01030 [Fontisphaera persica]
MSLFSTDDNPPPEPAHAWGMVAANLLLWPGLGTALARRKSGLVQMGLSGGGLIMALVGMVGFYFRWVTTTEFPGWRDRYVMAFVAGLGLFALAWFWALGSSIQIIRSSRSRAPAQAAAERPAPPPMGKA